jgi:MFS family permease
LNTVAAAQAAPRHAWKELWLITIGHGLTHWYPATFYLLLPLIGNELGLSYSQIGLIMTCQYIAAAIANIPGGVLVDTVGRKGLLMAVSLFWVGFPYLLISFTHSYVMLLVCIALVGFGNSLWHPTAIPTLGQRYPERKGLVLSLHGMGGNVGDAIAPLVIGAALAVFSWRQVVVMNVVPGLLVAALILLFLGTLQLGGRKAHAEAQSQSLRDYFGGLRQLFRNRALVLLCIGSSFRTMTQTALLTFLPVYLAHDMGYSLALVGACLFALQAAGFAAAPIAGHLSDRVGRKQILVGSMLTSAVVLALMAFAGGSPLFIGLVALLGFFLYATRPVIQAWLLETTPRNMGGSSIGVLFGAQAVGGALGPLLGGVVADHYGLLMTFYFLAATIVVANLFVLWVPKPQLVESAA